MSKRAEADEELLVGIMTSMFEAFNPDDRLGDVGQALAEHIYYEVVVDRLRIVEACRRVLETTEGPHIDGIDDDAALVGIHSTASALARVAMGGLSLPPDFPSEPT